MISLDAPANDSQSYYGSEGHGWPSFKRKKPAHTGSMVNYEGEIATVYFTSRMPCCDVKLAKGDFLNFLPFPGGILDEITGFLHGDFIQPLVGQKVIVSFTEGQNENPFISQLMWRPGKSPFSPRYKVEFPTLYKEKDVIRGHQAGMIQRMTNFPTPRIETGFVLPLDPTGTMGMVQGLGVGPISAAPLNNGLKLSDGGGPTGSYSEVAVAGQNYVLTALGLQPIISAKLFGPRLGYGTKVWA